MGNTTGGRGNGAGLPGFFVYFGCNVEVAEVVSDFQRAPEEGVVFLCEVIFECCQELHDVISECSDGL